MKRARPRERGPLERQARTALREAGLAARLKATPGVADAFVVAEEAAVYVKVDTQQLDRMSLERLVNPAPAC